MNDFKQIYREKLVSRIHALETAGAILQQHQNALKTILHIAHSLHHAVDFPDIVTTANEILTASKNEVPTQTTALIKLLQDFPAHSETEKSHAQMILDSLQQANKILSHSTQKQEALDSIQRLSHSLRGSGGTYGFQGITEQAALVEDAQEADVFNQLQSLLAELKQVTAEATATHTTLLILDDDSDMQLLLRQILAETGRTILSAQTASEANAILQNQAIDLLILDLILPDMDGRQFLMGLKSQAEFTHVPVIILTAKGSLPSTECFALGADGYFTKPFDPTILAAVISEKLQHHTALLQEARQDHLTGLPNRLAFHEAFQRMVAQSRRNDTPLSLAILDLDHFKRINDTCGHPIGDRVLKRTADILRQSLRQSDALARWGGEEFVVLFAETNQQGAQLALFHALQTLSQERFHCEHEAFSVTFSAGITDVAHHSSLEETIAEADQRLYMAKSNGRNQIIADREHPHTAKGSVLLAEDDELVASMVKFRFEKDGFNVRHCRTGTEALEAINDHSIKMIILDVKMPEMDGFQVLKNIRACSLHLKTPILMLTSMGNENHIIHAFDLGANDYMVKPFSPQELQARVYRLLKA